MSPSGVRALTLPEVVGTSLESLIRWETRVISSRNSLCLISGPPLLYVAMVLSAELRVWRLWPELSHSSRDGRRERASLVVGEQGRPEVEQMASPPTA